MDYTHQWSSEVDKMTQSFIEENFAPDHGVYEDILTRGKVDVPINGIAQAFRARHFRCCAATVDVGRKLRRAQPERY